MPDPVPADGCDRLIYLHGFRSSPRSIKAQMFARRMAQAGRATDFVLIKAIKALDRGDGSAQFVRHVIEELGFQARRLQRSLAAQLQPLPLVIQARQPFE